MAILSDATGNPITALNALPVNQVDPYSGRLTFTCGFDVAPSTVADATTYLTIRNGTTTSRQVQLRRFDLQQGFTGTAAASRSAWSLQKFTGTPSGGTAVPVVKRATSQAASDVTVLYAAAGLTTSSLTWDSGVIHRCAAPNQLNAPTTQDMESADGLVLAPNEGVAIRAYGAVVAGAFLIGSFGWFEI